MKIIMMLNFILIINKKITRLMMKRLIIESDNGDGALKVLGIKGIWDNLLDSFLSQIGGGNIKWIISSARSPSHLCLTVYAKARTRDLWRQNDEWLIREI